MGAQDLVCQFWGSVKGEPKRCALANCRLSPNPPAVALQHTLYVGKTDPPVSFPNRLSRVRLIMLAAGVFMKRNIPSQSRIKNPSVILSRVTFSLFARELASCSKVLVSLMSIPVPYPVPQTICNLLLKFVSVFDRTKFQRLCNRRLEIWKYFTDGSQFLRPVKNLAWKFYHPATQLGRLACDA